MLQIESRRLFFVVQHLVYFLLCIILVYILTYHTYILYLVLYWDFHVMIPRDVGDRVTRPPEGIFPRSPLAEFGGGTRSFAGDTEGCSNAVRGGRGVVARPLGVGWRSG